LQPDSSDSDPAMIRARKIRLVAVYSSSRLVTILAIKP
jgi:hypothetical protein